MRENEKPLMSICIPAYNNADYIVETIDALVNQTYENIEIVVVDDHSRDKTWEVINEYKNNFVEKEGQKRILNFQKNEKNLGMSGNWNKSLEMCSGKYIKLICADDLLDKTIVSREVEILEANEDVLCVSSDTQFVDMNGEKKGLYKRFKKSGVIKGIEAVKYSVYRRNYLGAPLANTFRKSVYDKIGGFDPSFEYIVDYDFYMRIYLEGKVYIIHEPLNFFRIRVDSNTGKVMGGGKGKAYIAEHRTLFEKAAPIIGLSKFQVNLCVIIRSVMSILGAIYLKVNIPKEK